MTIRNHHRTARCAIAVGAAALFAACGTNDAAVGPPDSGLDTGVEDGIDTGVDDVVRADLYCIVRQLPDDGEPHQTFEEICVYDGYQPDPYGYGVLRERVEEGGGFTSTGSDGSTRTGTCMGEYDVASQRAEREAGVLPYTPAALQGHQLCTFSGTLIGSGERAGQDLVEEGSMYQASETTFRGLVIVRPAP